MGCGIKIFEKVQATLLAHGGVDAGTEGFTVVQRAALQREGTCNDIAP
jgi:hypothetical protein